MSVVEDVRSAIQDFLAPELREIAARLESLEKVMNVKFDAVESKFDAVDSKFDSLTQQMNVRFGAVDSKLESLTQQMNSKFETQEAKAESLHREMNAKFEVIGNQIYDLKSALDLDRRMSRLESQQVSLPAKTA